jgi:hypothetical protein
MSESGAETSGTVCKSKALPDETPSIWNGVTPEMIHEILHIFEYPALIEEFDSCHIIKSSCHGISFIIALSNYDIEHETYYKMSATAHYEIGNFTFREMNQFNASNSYFKGYIEEDGGATIQMDLYVGHEITHMQLARWFQLWGAVMFTFEDYWYEMSEDYGEPSEDHWC